MALATSPDVGLRRQRTHLRLLEREARWQARRQSEREQDRGHQIEGGQIDLRRIEEEFGEAIDAIASSSTGNPDGRGDGGFARDSGKLANVIRAATRSQRLPLDDFTVLTKRVTRIASTRRKGTAWAMVRGVARPAVRFDCDRPPARLPLRARLARRRHEAGRRAITKTPTRTSTGWSTRPPRPRAGWATSASTASSTSATTTRTSHRHARSVMSSPTASVSATLFGGDWDGSSCGVGSGRTLCDLRSRRRGVRIQSAL